MYCPSCGKQIADTSSYCLYCGNPTSVISNSPSSQIITEWEYRNITLNWPPGQTGWLNADSYPEPSARLKYWQDLQSDLMPVLHELYDEGWQPMTEVGPSCIQLRHYKSLEGANWFWIVLMVVFTYGVGLLFLPFMGSWKFQMVGIYVKLRKPKSETGTSSSSPENIILDYSPSKQDFVERKQLTPGATVTPSPSRQPAKLSPVAIIAIVSVVFLCCFCVGLSVIWYYGDAIFFNL